MKSLLENPDLLAEILVIEAQRLADKAGGSHKPSDHIAQIMAELDLRFAVCD